MHPGLPLIGPVVLAAAVAFAAVLVVATLWPTSSGTVAVTIRVAQVVEPVSPADETAASRPNPATAPSHPVLGMGGASVVALRGATLERMGSGVLDTAGNVSLRLRPASYVVCVTLPAQLHPVAPSAAVPNVPLAASIGGWVCQPVTVAQHPSAPVTMTVASGGA